MISLNYRDSRPIYLQLKDNFRNQIVQGILSPHDKLPSVRDLAGELSINPNTIQRAYRELESEGYLYTVPGKGSFIAPTISTENPRKLQLLVSFDQIAQELLFLGVNTSELCSRIEHLSTEGGITLD